VLRRGALTPVQEEPADRVPEELLARVLQVGMGSGGAQSEHRAGGHKDDGHDPGMETPPHDAPSRQAKKIGSIMFPSRCRKSKHRNMAKERAPIRTIDPMITEADVCP